MVFEDLLAYALENECSDVHITVGTSLAIRRFGQLRIMDSTPTPQESRDMILSVLNREQREYVLAGGDLDVGVILNNGIRIRANIYHQRNNLAASIRLLQQTIPTIEDLGLPKVVQDMAELPHGLVLVTGPTGSGKSTTLAAMVNHINVTRPAHIMTIEDPIEYIYPHQKAMIHQRELGKDVSSYSTALRSALREDPDIILVGEMRDFETISAAITAAETGHLVLSTLHCQSAAQTVERIIDASPIDAQNQIRAQFANVLSGVITQQLLPLADGTGRVVAAEIMVATTAICNLIRDNKSIQITSMMQSGKKQGMTLMNDELLRLVREHKVSKDVALSFSHDPASLDRNFH